ncbi:hypothetical protein HPB50_001379 [Hyalomma asiaticum]|uniref:Uncharacterized protein n=1 Tax=Hyalomma asiaticum TaxID=266040 RepID=A0ACB7TB84_HYAAI|nr:hypothetical protein HPB50_001379 [Hyalomma asiaticum]
MAIRLAILHSTEADSLLMSDAKTAIRSYRKGWISVGAPRALNARARVSARHYMNEDPEMVPRAHGRTQ